jgi:hypothetical protein
MALQYFFFQPSSLSLSLNAIRQICLLQCADTKQCIQLLSFDCFRNLVSVSCRGTSTTRPKGLFLATIIDLLTVKRQYISFIPRVFSYILLVLFETLEPLFTPSVRPAVVLGFCLPCFVQTSCSVPLLIY